MTKIFTITKTGYSAGVYGCSNEYFMLTYMDSRGFHIENFSGMYGAEDRVANILKSAGYKEHYSYSNWGKLTRKDVRPQTWGEHTMCEILTKSMKRAISYNKRKQS